MGNFCFALKFLIAGMGEILIDKIYSRRNRVELKPKPNHLAIITGGNRGIGLRIVEKLLRCGINVVIACRDPNIEKIGVEDYMKDNGVTGNIAFEKLDTSDMTLVREFANLAAVKYPKINYLINNAGIMAVPFKLTNDGFEMQMAVNYLGHFLLTHLLLPQLKAAGTENEYARIVNVASCVNKLGVIDYDDLQGKSEYNPVRAYCNSKLAVALFTVHLNVILNEQNCHVQVNSVHPGVVNTQLFENTTGYSRFFQYLVYRTPEQGSRSAIYATISEKLERVGGNYIASCGIANGNPLLKDPEACKKYFEFTSQLLGIKKFGQ